MRHLFFLGLTLTVFWLVLSGFFTPLMLGFGLFSVLLVLVIVHRMDVVDHEGHPLHLRPHRLLMFWMWLLKEIVVSNLTVAKIIMSSRLQISPTVTTLNVGDLSVVGQTIYANSITLTPGSLTIELEPDGDITIHTLTSETAAELAESSLGERLVHVEEGWLQKENS